MKNFEEHYKTLKEILSGDNSPEIKNRYEKEIQRVSTDTDIWNFEDSDRDIMSALSYKIPRIKGWHPNYVRDKETNLTLGIDGFSIWNYPDPWENASDEQIFKPITNHMKPLYYAGGKGAWDIPFVSGKTKRFIRPDDKYQFVGDLTESTHKIVNYIVENVKVDWAWRKDLYAFAIYTFEFFFEYVYDKVILNREVSLNGFKPKELHSYPIKNLPVKAEQYMLTKEDRLNDILDSTFDFIEFNNYHLSRNPIWMRTILFQVGLGALKVVLESENI